MLKKWLSAPYILWSIVFTLLPLLLILIYGITVQDDGLSFSLVNIQKVFTPIYFKALLRSINYALIATLICLLLAYPLAMILSEQAHKSTTMIFIFILPMWMNFLLRTYAWLSILETNSGVLNTILRALKLPALEMIGTPSAIILGMVYNFLPFMILPIYNVLSKIDPFVLEAANDLGANAITQFRKVVLPLSLPGVISGITMVFMPAVTTFVIPKLLGNGKINLVGNLIEQQFVQSYNWYFGASLSLVLMAFILFSMAILNRVTNGKVV